MTTLTQNPAPTLENVWAAFLETDRRMKETDRIIKENARIQKENERIVDKQLAEMRKELGYFGESQGSFAEEYFFNSFKKGKKNFFGKNFNRIQKNVKPAWNNIYNIEDEYDIVMYNADSIAIIEVKFKLRKDDIEKTLRKAETFKIIFPDYKNIKVYLGLASMIFPEHIERECIKQGIAVIKQDGDKVVINEENLKAF
jgi:hypothetical protein